MKKTRKQTRFSTVAEMLHKTTSKKGNGLYRKLQQDDTRSACGNCAWVGVPKIGLEEIRDLNERLDPGGVVPSGECPKCGALCYLEEAK